LRKSERGASEVGLSMQSRLDMVVEAAKKYRRASKKEKGDILDSLVTLTGYNRAYASYPLGLCVKKVLVRGSDGKVYRLVAGPKAKKSSKPSRRYLVRPGKLDNHQKGIDIGAHHMPYPSLW
jgi:hypothetical protein